MQFSPYGSPIP